MPARTFSHLLPGCAILAALGFTSVYNYLFFHTVTELFAVVVSCGTFMIAWNARRTLDNNYFLLIGIAYLSTGLLDVLHTLSYKNMNIFAEYDANHATQLWLAARGVQTLSLLVAPLFVRRRMNLRLVLAVYGTAVSLLLMAVLNHHFPDCFISGTGLTPFKKKMEYCFIVLLAVSLWLLHRRRQTFDPLVFRLLVSATLITIVSEFTFTLYQDVSGIFNMAGHLLKVGGFYFIYKAVIETGIARPYDLLYRNLKQSEEALRKSEEMFSKAFRTMPAMLAISTLAEGRIIDVNDVFEEKTGFRRDEVVGRLSVDLNLFQDPADRDVMVGMIEREGRVRGFELPLRDRGGRPYVFLWGGEAVEIGGEACLISLASDITFLKETEQALRSANQELEAFNYTVSHDLRGPLTVIRGSCDVLMSVCRGLGGNEQALLGNIQAAALQMTRLIETLLNFSRLSRQSLVRDRVDLSEMAAAVAGELQQAEPGRRVKLAIMPGLQCHGDPGLLHVVLVNLIGNAWKYTCKKKVARIEVGCTTVNGTRAFFVRDNGAGFAMADSGKLFEPFHRLHPADEFDGLGIGLATVQRVILRHGGKVWAEGKVGEEATFFFTLPESRQGTGWAEASGEAVFPKRQAAA